MSIRKLRAHLTRDDSGMGIVEVITAFMIFAIIMIGMGMSMTSMTRLTAETTNRETAANLAAGEIDRIQSQKDAFKVFDKTDTRTIDGVKYTIKTSVGWIPTSGGSGNCGTGGGTLQYKRVNVVVSWTGMYLPGGVRADTTLAPATRINDPATGTILVSVIDVNGEGSSAIAVSATKTSGGTGISGTIDPTDVDGCTYILKAPPGDYNITITKSGYIDTTHASSPVTRAITVVAGAATPVQFQFDKTATFTPKYASNSTATVTIPTDLKVTYFGHLNIFTEASSTTRKLFPWADGYQIIAGDPTGCLAVDPQNWSELSPKAAGVVPVAVQAAPGGSANIPVPMGVFTLKMPNTSDSWVTAVAQNAPGSGNPGCATALKYSFAKFTKNTTVTLALPYGTWRLYTSTSAAGATTTAVVANVTVTDGIIKLNSTGGVLTGQGPGGSFTNPLLTLDPRAAL